MPSSTTFAFVFFVAGLIGSRLLGQKAMQELSRRQKTELAEFAADFPVWRWLPLIVLVALYFVGLETLGPERWMFYVFFGLLVVYWTAISVWAFRKLKKLGFPDRFYSLNIYSRLVGIAGICGLLFAVAI